MVRAGISAAGFALAGGVAADPTGAVHIDPGPDRLGRILLASVEPLESSPRGMELAAAALRTMRATFAATPGAAADALVAAFAAANALLMAENRPLATGKWARRICVGATGIVITGREIVVAQVAPSQAILVQDGQVYAFPDIASWRGDYLPDRSPAEAHPLGFGDEAMPRLYESQAAPGDLIVLCATGVGRALAGDEDAVVGLYSGDLLTSDLEGSVDRLERLLVRHDVHDAYAVVATIARLPRRTRERSGLPLARRNVRDDREAFTAGALAEAIGDRSPVPTPEPHLPLMPSSPPRFDGFRDWVLDLAELFSSRRGAPAPRYAPRQAALLAPGALSVRRYRESSGIPAEWRANLPRGPGVQMPARLLAVSLVLFVALGGTGIAVGRQRDREARATSALVMADAALLSARENPGTAMSSVVAAETAVAAAREAGANGETLARQEQELAVVRDDVWGIRRLGDVVRLGALPEERGDGPVRLALAGKTLVVAAGNLYELDAEGQRLIALLSQGDEVAGGAAGDLRHVSIDDGAVVASDGSASYVRDNAGRWQRHDLAVDMVRGLQADAPVIAWGDAAYGLSWEGDIVRFDRSSGTAIATVWAAAADTPDLELARDFAIDGRIHVLLDDGRTLTFARGALVGTMAPFVVPAISGPSFLASAPFANALYIVDRNGAGGDNAGRIVRVDAAGDAWQYLTPPPLPGDPAAQAETTLAEAEDLVVDELTGVVYWVARGEIWRATLPIG